MGKKFMRCFNFVAIFFILSTAGVAHSEVTNECETSKPLKTAFGLLSFTECIGPSAKAFDSVNLNGQPLLRDRSLFRDDRDSERARWVYTSGTVDEKSACASKLYLLDISKNPPKVFAFGVRGACNKFDWASWGEKRSVIAIKKNVRFVYENGQLKAPAKSEKLWLSVEPPHAGEGLAEEDAIPFVEEVPLPK